jgi:hypothetical protein
VIPLGAVETAVSHATAFEATPGPARAEVVTAELFDKLDVAMNKATTSFDMGFRGEMTSGAWTYVQKQEFSRWS